MPQQIKHRPYHNSTSKPSKRQMDNIQLQVRLMDNQYVPLMKKPYLHFCSNIPSLMTALQKVKIVK